MSASTAINKFSDSITRWVGSTASLFLHTLFFIFSFVSHWLFGWGFDFILLVLTTVVSLEAIYLAIFIQRAVNRQAERLEDVEESIDDVEEALDDVEEALDDVEEGLEDVEKQEKSRHKAHKQIQEPTAQLLKEVRELLLELKNNK